LGGLPNTLQKDHAYLMLRMQRWQGRIASSTNQLWPCLSPFIFRTVLEAMLTAAPEVRKRSLLVRRMLSEHQPRVAVYPLEHGHPAMPMTLRNMQQFWPLVPHYAERAWRKAARIAGFAAAGPKTGHVPSWRAAMWSEEKTRSRLDPATMYTASLYDRRKLEAFLQRSQQAEFRFEAQWSRLFSLESALHALKDAGVPRTA
jgi:hypothetical protein